MQTIHTTKELQALIREHLEKLELTAQSIRDGTAKNPFPVGRRNVLELYGGRDVSLNIRARLTKFFNAEKQQHEQTSKAR